MAIGTGLSRQFGFAAESTYGTTVTPNRFIRTTGFKIKETPVFAQGQGMGGSRLLDAGQRRYKVQTGGSGPVEFEVPVNKVGLLFQALMGTTVTPVQQGGTTAYLQTHTLADPRGKFLTMQGGIPDLTGTVRPYTAAGCKVLGAELSCGVGEILTCSMDVDARNITEAVGLAADSYTSDNLWHYGQMAVKLGTFGTEAEVTSIKKVSVKIDRKSNTERNYAGTANQISGVSVKAEPLINDRAEIVTGSLDVDFVDKALFTDRFTANTPTSLVWEFIGPTISGAFKETFRVTLPQVFFNGETPESDGADAVAQSIPFVCLDDGTNLPKIEIISTDTTL